ncbi:MAG TPA: nuclear transport factor 2 family protein [Caulobacteraceae bacterium]|nr:nuclear transport factor 2 family protein [Caulobacteraceae bacterium]
MNSQELLDHTEIRALITAYNVAGDRGRVEELGAVFAEDGVLLTTSSGAGRLESTGPRAIAERLGAARVGGTGPDRPLEFVRHHQTTCQITLDGADEARGRTYFIVFSEIGLDHSGLYIDRFRKVDGAWKIAHREVRIDWVAENGHTRATRR